MVILSINRKNSDLECYPNNEFSSIELIKIASDINSAEMLTSSRYFALNKLRIIRKSCLKFYHLLVLLSGDSSLNPEIWRRVLLATLGLIYALIGEMFSQIQLKMYFSIYLFQSLFRLIFSTDRQM